MEQETPEWSPFAEAMERAWQAWQTDAGGDEFICLMDDAMDAWAAYRDRRYGPHTPRPVDDPAEVLKFAERDR